MPRLPWHSQGESANPGTAATIARMAAEEDVVTMDKIVALCKRRGFIFASSEIYGGLGSTYDYGHYGVLLKTNVKNEWWRAMLQERDDIVALESFWCRACSCISSWLRTSSLSSCCCASLLIHLCEKFLCAFHQFFLRSFDLSHIGFRCIFRS